MADDENDEKWIQGAVKRPGAFTKKAKAAGKSVAGFARQVLSPKSKASTLTKQQGNFAARMAKLRAGKAKFLVPLVLVAGNGVWAANLTCPQGLLTPTPQTAIGPSANTFTARAAPAVVVQGTNTAGTISAEVDICCGPLDCTLAGNWAPVTSGALNVGAATGSAAVSMIAPTCTYRTNVTACSACSFQAVFACSGP